MAADIFSEFELNGFHLKNRLGVAPMTRMSSVADSIPRQDVLDFLVRRAENGAGLIFTEAIVTDYESAQGYPKARYCSVYISSRFKGRNTNI